VLCGIKQQGMDTNVNNMALKRDFFRQVWKLIDNFLKISTYELQIPQLSILKASAFEIISKREKLG
jgi:hypothetical protein